MARRALSAVILSLILLGVILRGVFFAVSVTRVPPAMDECITALQSKGIVEARGTVEAQAKRYPQPILGRFPLLFMSQPYLFPLESYLNTLFIGWLPRNAFGIRALPALMGVLCVWLSWLTLRRWGPLRDTWPGLVLIMLPSAYLLMIQAGYSPPGYSSFLFFSALVIYLAQRYRDGAKSPVALAALTGFCAGLAVASQMLALPVLVAAGGMIAVSRPWKKTLAALPAFVAAAMLGFLPYYAGKLVYPGAHEAVSGVRTLADALGRIWPLALSYTLPTAMGINCCLFPDSVNRFELLADADKVFPYVWLVALGAATLVSSCLVIRELARHRRLCVRTSDLFVAISWMGLLLFVVSSRAYSHSFRYMLAIVWSFPFVVVHLYKRAGHKWRLALGVLAVALGLLNLSTGIVLAKTWTGARFAAEEPRIYDLEPAIAYLRERGITRCYANYFDTYRINYMTDEQIICSQHYNVRFAWWPLPYKDVVDASTNVAYVLGAAWRFPPEEFETALREMEVDYVKTVCGEASVYTAFREVHPRAGVAVPRAEIAPSVFRNETEAPYLVDGDYNTRWRSLGAQHKGMWTSFKFDATQSIARLSMYYNSYYHDHAETMNVLAHTPEGWCSVVTNVAWDLEHFEMINGHPVYGNIVHDIEFPPVLTDEIKIEVEQPLQGRDWSFGEARFYTAQ